MPMSSDAAVAAVVGAVILFGVMPLWMLAGFADWLCHRHTGIERTSGLPESLLHVLLLLEMGPATLIAAFFEINALVVAILLVAFAAHQVTLYADLRYSSARRHIPPIEQMVHSALEYVPVIGGVLVLVLNWTAVESLFGFGAPPEFALVRKTAPLSAAGIVAFAVALALLVLLPYAEEVWRCWRHARRARV